MQPQQLGGTELRAEVGRAEARKIGARCAVSGSIPPNEKGAGIGSGVSERLALRCYLPPFGFQFLARSLSGSVSQRRTVKSPDAETSRVPSGLKATDCT